MKQKPKTKIKLTRKQSKFVDEYVKTGNGTQSANKAYDVKNNKVASVIATENLAKPSIQSAIEEALPDELLEKKHLQLLEAINLEKLRFNEHDSDEMIEEVISQMPGYKLLHIVENKGTDGKVFDKYAYVKGPDNMTQDKALDKAYKLKGSYAPIKQDAKVEIVDGLTDDEKIKLKNLIK